MAVDQLIKTGESLLEDKDYLGAISGFNQALKENPQAYQALLKRSIAFQRLKNYDSAKRDITEAYQVAEQRGHRAQIGECYFRLGLIFYAERDFATALKNLQRAKEHDSQEKTLDTWIAKAEYDIKKLAGSAGATEKKESQPEGGDTQVEEAKAEENDVSAQAAPVLAATGHSAGSSTHIDTINKHAPLKIKIRDDWYQTAKDVTITIFAKNIAKDQLVVKFTPNSVSISFPSGPSSEYKYNLDPLFGEIDTDLSSFRVYGTKLEIVLVKTESIKWGSLEKPDGEQEALIPTVMGPTAAASTSYPTSSKKAVDWSRFKVADEEIEDADKSENDFFAKLYKDTDDDTRRAMMKSYVESNGTVLTTNWGEAKDKTYETSPPDGMVAKSWNNKPVSK